MSRDPLTAEIARLADGIAALRIVRKLIRTRGQSMTIEIKGLGANVEAARAAIRRSRVAMARVGESGVTLERTANEIASVFEQHTSDLLREANTMGNGSSESETQSGERVTIKPADVGKIEAVIAVPEVAKPVTTFPVDPGAAA